MPFARLRDLSHTLRFRLMAWLILVVFVMVVVTMLAVREVAWRRLQDEFDQVLREDTVEIELAIQQLYPDKLDQLILGLERRATGHEYRDWFVQLYDRRDHLIWASSGVPDLPAPKFTSRAPRLYDAQKFRLLEAGIQRRAGGETVYLRTGSSRQSLEEDIALLNRIMILAGVFLVLLAPLGGFVLAGRATRPIAWIISTTARLQPDNLAERLPVRGTDDELDRLALTINGMLDRLGSYIESNRTFVANAAHELRSPLAAIRSSVEVGLNRGRTAEEYVSLLIDVMEECTRLSNLINRLLILAEGDAGRLAARDQTVQLDKIVHESIDMFSAVAESQDVRLASGELPSALIPGDEHHVRQVVRNLIDNAIKFSPPPGTVQIDLRIDAARRQAVLSVRDQGVGIPPETLPHIFERFYRGDPSRPRASADRGGYGLGLSICQVIVQALQGEIAVESSPGQGTLFTVRLPLAEPAPPGSPPAEKALAQRAG